MLMESFNMVKRKIHSVSHEKHISENDVTDDALK